MAANGEMSEDLAEGAVPLRLAAEANSTANHVREDFRDYRVEQAKVNRSLIDLIANVERNLSRRVTAIGTSVTDLRADLGGQAKAARRFFALAGLAVAVVAAAVPVVLHFLERAR